MSISRVSYLREAALLPVLTPLFSLPIQLQIDSLGINLPWLSFICEMAFSAALVFGVPYLMVAGVALFIIRKRSWRVHLLVASISPLIYALAIIVFLGISNFSNGWSTGFFIVPFVLAVGYGYFLLAYLGMVFFQKLGWVKDTPA